MEHLALEIFDLPTTEDPKGTGSQYATLPEDTVITITDTSEIFASGDVWSHSFTLNAEANAHIFGTAADLHGSRLHDQIDRRRARLWVEGLPLYLGYLRLDGEAEVDGDGNIDVRFESGQKTFEEMIEGISAQEVSVGDDVVIGIALNRKRVSEIHDLTATFTLDGLEAFAVKDQQLAPVREATYSYGRVWDMNRSHYHVYGNLNGKTQYVQRWPKLVKSHGKVLDSSGSPITPDYTNVQMPYDGTERYPFCNINICYPLKVNKNGEEVAGRGYTTRLARGKETTDGGDYQTRFNNAPNFYLLYFIDHLFKDMEIHIEENQAMDVEDLRRVFLLNYGCFYEEIEDTYAAGEQNEHLTPGGKRGRYGQYYMPIIDGSDHSLIYNWIRAGEFAYGDRGLDHIGKILLRNVEVKKGSSTLLKEGSLEGVVQSVEMAEHEDWADYLVWAMTIDRTQLEGPASDRGFYSAYKAYATGENYPKVEISEIIDAMKSMFGVRLLFNSDYSSVRIVLLRNVFRSQEVQDIECEIIAPDVKVENNTRGFRMTYSKGTEDTSFYYKGFNDTFSRAGKIWKDTADKHDYSQWDLDADYGEIKQYVSAMNKKCYVTPLTGNAYIIKVDEEEDVLFPSLFEAAGFMDAEDGDCTRLESESETVEEIQVSASPVIMNETENTYASLFSGELKAPAPDLIETSRGNEKYYSGWADVPWLATYGRVTTESRSVIYNVGDLTVKGLLDIYITEGFQIRLLDNYGISNVGTPFDDADPGLQFGIMRSSGDDAYVRYYDDPDDDENDAWDIQPGSGAISYPDTCDGYGNEWDYTGSEIVTPAMAPAKLSELFPDSDAPFRSASLGYITDTFLISAMDSSGTSRRILIAAAYSIAGATVDGYSDLRTWSWRTVEEILEISRSGRHMVVEVDSSNERGSTLVQLCRLAYGGGTEPMRIDDGVGSRYGRFSLKLRAQKPNPYYDPDEKNPYSRNYDRYLPIGKESLRDRGLMDQFYKEYSKWIREARIAKRTVQMTLAQLLAIDKTKHVRVGDIMGFIRKTRYSVSNKTGLGTVEMEILYI